MKTFIATSLIILASSGANASGHLTAFDSQEFYSGQPDSRLVTNSVGNPRSLYVEGNYAGIIPEAGVQDIEGDRIGNASPDSELYLEAKWPV